MGEMTTGRYPDLAAVLRDDEVALMAVWQAHTARHGGALHACRQGGCEARSALEEAIGKIRLLLAAE